MDAFLGALTCCGPHQRSLTIISGVSWCLDDGYGRRARRELGTRDENYAFTGWNDHAVPRGVK